MLSEDKLRKCIKGACGGVLVGAGVAAKLAEEKYEQHMKKYPIEEKTVEELVAEANRILAAGVTEMTEEEEMEDDAEGGYFEDD